MSLEAWGDDGCDVPDGYVTAERAEEMALEALQERADQLRAFVRGDDPVVPASLQNVPYVAMLAIADWLTPA